MVMPRGSEAPRPHPSILDASMSILINAPRELHPLLPPFLENCILRAPEKAPPRATLASACATVLTGFGNDVSAQLLHFLAVLTYSPSQGLRSLALLCLEAMAVQVLDTINPQVRPCPSSFLTLPAHHLFGMIHRHVVRSLRSGMPWSVCSSRCLRWLRRWIFRQKMGQIGHVSPCSALERLLT